MDLLASPLVGYIHPLSWIRPSGNPDFKVTRDAAGHIAAAGPPADDFGDRNALDVDPVLAPHDATVGGALTIGSANLYLDFTDRFGQRCRIVLAHNRLPHPVSVGQKVTRGQRVGTVGATGATAQHLHLQYGYRVWWGWRWLDPWLYLEQHHNLQANAGAVANLRSAAGLTGPIRGVTLLGGIVVDGERVADHGAILLRRPVATVTRDGYEWMPIALVGVALPLWIARPFVHFL